MSISEIDKIKECIEWICQKVGNVTTEEEVERLCLRYLIAKDFTSNIVDFSRFYNEVKNAMFYEPIYLNQKHYSERVERSEGVYYCVHSIHNKEDMERAKVEMVKSRRLIDSESLVEKLLKNFFYSEDFGEYCGEFEKSCGNSIVSSPVVNSYNIFRIYKRRYTYWVFLSLIDDVFEDISIHIKISKKIRLKGGIYVIVVLTENTPLPFIKFFKCYSEIVRRSKFLIWVVDVEREILNPFIGYPPEKDLIKKFHNPRIATTIESLWRTSIMDTDEYM